MLRKCGNSIHYDNSPISLKKIPSNQRLPNCDQIVTAWDTLRYNLVYLRIPADNFANCW